MCCFRYLSQYKGDINKDREEKSEDYGKEVLDQINLFFESLKLSSTGYTVSFCRDELYKIIADINIDNGQTENLLINYFGEGICFAYPNDRKIPQMFFLCMFVLEKLLNPFEVKR